MRALLDALLTAPQLAPSREMVVAHAKAARDAARGRAPAILGALDGFLLQLGVGSAAGSPGRSRSSRAGARASTGSARTSRASSPARARLSSERAPS